MNWQDLPPLSALRAFAAVAEAGNFSAAGKALNVSHAAIGQQVRALERRLGCALALREGRGVALTPEGKALALALENGFRQIEDAIQALTGADAARPLQVSLTPSFASVWLMPRLHRFRDRHPDIELMLNPSADVVALDPGGIDAAIRFGTGAWPGLDAELLIPTRQVIAAHRDLVAGRAIANLSDLSDLPWMQEYGTNELTSWLATEDGSVRPGNVTHLPGYMLIEALKRGEAVAATVDLYIAEEVASGSLRILFTEDRPGAGYWLVTRPGVQRAPLKAFAKWLRAEVTRA